MTRDEMRARYEQMLGGTETIESRMYESPLTHLNAEIASAGTYMSDVPTCLRWLKCAPRACARAASPRRRRPALDLSLIHI